MIAKRVLALQLVAFVWKFISILSATAPVVLGTRDNYEKNLQSILERPGNKSVTVGPTWFVDQSRAAFAQTSSTLPSQGYRLISLSVYGASHRYASVWVPQAGVEQVFITDQSGPRFDAWLAKWSSRGYTPTLVTATGSVYDPIFAGVMDKGLDSDWSFRRDITGDTFGLYLDSAYDNQRKRLVSFREYGLPGQGSRFCAIWHGNPNFDKEYIVYGQSSADIPALIGAQWTKPYWHPSYVSLSDTGRVSYLFSDLEIGLYQGPLSPLSYPVTDAVLRNMEQGQLHYGRHLIHLQGFLTDYNTGSSLFHAIWAGKDAPLPREWHATGLAAHGFKNNAAAVTEVDNIMKDFMQKSGVRQAQIAIGKAGDVLLSRAYSWSESSRHITQPEDTFLLASVSKMFCEAAVQSLFDMGKLSRATRPWDDFEGYPWKIFHFPPVDPRIKDITMDDLLNHRGGWDRNANPNLNELVFRMREISQASSPGFPPTIDSFVSYLNGVHLDFTPGTGYAYSNIGYIVLSKVVETVAGTSYFNHLKGNVLAPLGLDNSVKVWSSNRANHIREPVTQESRYVGLSAEDPTSQQPVANIFGGDGMHKEAAVGPSALAASAATLVKFVAKHAAWGNGPRCIDCWRDGLMSGARTIVESRSDGIDWAVVLNTAEFAGGDQNFQDLLGNLRTWLNKGQVS